jgi:hypothetical protein
LTPHREECVGRRSELWQLDATTLAGMLAGGAVSAREVVCAFLDRISRIDGQLNAIPTLVAERALAEADAADRWRASGNRIGPLHGLPIAVKDLVDTAGIRTTYGSPIYRNHVPAEDALLVKRLRRAGAIILGKTNTPEFGAGSQTFNPVFGPTRNPYDTSRTPGGSSGGAAAAVAACMLPFADGSDMGGSLLQRRWAASYPGPHPRGVHDRWLGSAVRLGADGPYSCRPRAAPCGHLRAGFALSLVTGTPGSSTAATRTSPPHGVELESGWSSGGPGSDRGAT